MGAGAALIINSGARAGEQALAEVQEALAEADVAVGASVILSEADGLTESINRALDDGHAPILIGGGDGSVSAAADVLARRRAVLGLVPLGTANDFARTLGIPSTVAEACAVIARGAVIEVDLGRVNGETHFLNQAATGLIGNVTDLLPHWLKRLSGPLAYPISTAVAFAHFQPFDADLTFPDGDHPPMRLHRLLHLAVGNGRYYGGGMVVAPRATPDDGLLDLSAIHLGRWRELLSVATTLRSGDYIHRRGVRYFRTTAVEIDTNRALAVVADGEPVGTTPCRIDIAPAALRVLAPHRRQPIIRQRHGRKSFHMAS